MLALSPRARSVAYRFGTERRLPSLLRFVGTAALSGLALSSGIAAAQDSTKQVAASAFFESQNPIEVTLTTNINGIRSDKTQNPPWRLATITYKGAEGNLVTVPLRARTRGIWRLRMCEFPPLRLNFSEATSKGTVFHLLDKPKLVSYCHNMDSHEQYILQEYQLYRIYQVLTPVSHKARLLRVVYADSADRKVRATRYAFITEEPGALATRLGGTLIEQHGARPGDLDSFQDALFGVFQYFIGNTDFSEAGLHNVELLLTTDGVVKPIAYDFDFAGAVNARYAVADATLGIPNVRQRLFRGYCLDPESYAKAIAVFQEKKSQIYALYSDSIGMLMDRGTARETLRYFDDFYRTVDDKRAVKRSLVAACIRPTEGPPTRSVTRSNPSPN